MTSTPNLHDYISFIDANVLKSAHGTGNEFIVMDSTGNYVVQGQYSNTLEKMYILRNWDKLKQSGIGDEQLWKSFGSLDSNERLRFDVTGKQISYSPTLNNLNRTLLTNIVIQSTIRRYTISLILVVVYVMIAFFIGYLLVTSDNSAEDTELRRQQNLLKLFKAAVN